MGDKMLWNKNKTRSVRASLIRAIEIVGYFEGQKVKVEGWIAVSGPTDTFDFGEFESYEKAVAFVEILHNLIEG